MEVAEARQFSEYDPMPAGDSLGQLLKDPELYLWDVDWSRKEANFLRMPGNWYANYSLHSRQYLAPRLADGAQQFNAQLGLLRDVRAPLEANRPAPRFIFHLTLGGSTLLCRCLEATGRALVLKEPGPLAHLAFNREMPEWRESLRDVLAFYSRTSEKSQAAIIKPFVHCNWIMPELMAHRAGVRAVFLSQSLERFVTSILKKPERHAGIRQEAALAQRYFFNREFDPHASKPARAAAFFWAACLSAYQACPARSSGDLRALDSDAFFAGPEESLVAVCEFFGAPVARAKAESVVKSGIFERDSKESSRAFNAAEQRETTERVSREHASEIADAAEFAAQLFPDGRIPTWEPFLF
jgi:hypothetical protein